MHTLLLHNGLCRLLLLTLLLLTSCAGEEQGEKRVIVAGAASMADVLRALDTLTGSTGPRVTVAAGASNILARSLREGAPYDIFVSLDPAIVTDLAREGRIDSLTTVEIARNRLVVASTAAPDTLYRSFDFLRGARRIALASEGVPLRVYSEQALRRAGLWDSLLPRFVYGADARQVAEMVRNKDVDAGLLYATDAQQRTLAVLYSVPPELHDPIRIVAAATAGHTGSEVKAVLGLLTSKEFQARLAQRGFEIGNRE